MANEKLSTSSFTTSANIKVSYVTAGAPSGPLLIFVHGWPANALTWKNQLTTFASLGFYCVAPDNRGYGSSSVPKNHSDYKLELLVDDLLALLSHLKRTQAVWIGHDWGCGPVWSLAAHHPEVCAGVVNLCLPYRMVELGLNTLVSTVDRNLYPEEEFPYGQWDYQHFYEVAFNEAVSQLDAKPGHTIRALYQAGSPATYGQRPFTASISAAGGIFPGGNPPDVPLSYTLLADEPEVYQALEKEFSANGFAGATAWYMNHDANNKYNTDSIKNGGVLTMPVLYVHAMYDNICFTTGPSSINDPMREYCKDLTECTVQAGHWVNLEKPREFNAQLSRWLVEKCKGSWPGYWTASVVSKP